MVQEGARYAGEVDPWVPPPTPSALKGDSKPTKGRTGEAQHSDDFILGLFFAKFCFWASYSTSCSLPPSFGVIKK
eukprot:scaffold21489_cov67-Phaeocystis_antarctica.AAC.2